MEEIYANIEDARPVKPKPSAHQTGPRSSKKPFHRAMVLCLGLLSVFLLAGLIGLGIHYHGTIHDSMAELSSISEERDLLKANLTEMELDRLQCFSKQKKTCPSQWIMFSCSCYFFSTVSDSWEKGRQDCRDKRADLVKIDSYEEQEFLSKIIQQTTWIGLNDRENEKIWKWSDETPLTVAYWAKMQPDNGGGSEVYGEEDCVDLRHGGKPEENWNDLNCDKKLRWICEF
ncbi:C-type lectin domain family 4 member E-like isoform X1 [Larimichthys crocea]|uniref:C-type lectin domain family 4 member E-like isoform X1 n=1 Tax=Larimichthys crocea TaxID=215358 RepID=UPI000F5F899A|nr:C-type lectin domain family 4 member E-like isoform X1 [Larimichthys crocea]